jgi:predicted enzyme related to lactoylglutathione lyase
MSSADNRGRFVWHDLMTTDTKAASGFYSKVLGWKTQAWDKNPDYTLWLGANGMLGGLMALPQEARTAGAAAHWLAYIVADNLDTSLQTAERLGARVVKGATEVPDVGRFAVVADPQGAAFCVFQQGGAQGGSGGGGPLSNDFSWHELASPDPIASLRFYGELFGWENTDKHDMGPMGFYYLIGMKGIPFAGLFKPPAERPMPPHWLCYAHVPDIDKATNAAKAAGGKVTHGPMEVPGGTWITQLVDPQGAPVALHADKKAALATPAAQPAKPAAPKSPPSARPAVAKPQAAAVKAPTSAPVTSPTPTPKAVATAPAAAKKAAPAAKKAAPAKKKPAAKTAVAKKKPAAAKKRPTRKPKSSAKSAMRKVAVKRKAVKKRAVAHKRRASKSGFEVAKRFAAKQAGSLLKRLRGKKHR